MQGNFLGLDVGGTSDLGNTSSGVIIEAASGNLVGGTTEGARNVISGANYGVSIVAGSTNNLVQGNYIGTDRTGTQEVGNRFDGVEIENSPDNLVGGTAPGAGNLLSGNHSGIYIGGDGATGNLVQGNMVGTDYTGTAPLPNIGDGIEIRNADGNTIGGITDGASNTIAFNGGDGVAVFSGVDNDISGNSIFSNGGLGIDLIPDGVTLNDDGDGDGGPNGLQNFPTLVSAVMDGGTLIRGTFNSKPDTEFRVEYFSNRVCDPSGHGEGESFLAAVTLITGENGNTGFGFIPNAPPVPAGYFITATATDPNGNTSEFSSCVKVIDPSSLHLVQGTVVLQGMPEPLTGAIVVVRAPDGTVVGETVSDPVDGSFQVRLSSGFYDLLVAKDGFLPAHVEGLPVEGDLDLPVVELRWGDVDGNGVGVTDLAITGNNFGEGASPWEVPRPGSEVVDRIEEAIQTELDENGELFTPLAVQPAEDHQPGTVKYEFDEVEVRYAARFTANPVQVAKDNWLALLAGGPEVPIEVVYGAVGFRKDGERLSFKEEFIKVTGEKGSARFLINSGAYEFYEGTGNFRHANSEFSSHKIIVDTTLVKDFTPPLNLIFLRRSFSEGLELEAIVLAGFLVDDLQEVDFFGWSPTGENEYVGDLGTLVHAGDSSAAALDE